LPRLAERLGAGEYVGGMKDAGRLFGTSAMAAASASAFSVVRWRAC